MMTGNVVWLENVGRSDLAIVGGKGANLGELMANGFPVPPGFVVTAPACRHFFASLDLVHDLAELARAPKKQGEKYRAAMVGKIRREPLPSDLEHDVLLAYEKLRERCGPDILCAVRSSATFEDLKEASFAGQHGTYYYVDEAHLLSMIRNCWASLWSDAAMSYRSTHGIDHAGDYMAVIVQEMVRSEVSGVTFTVNPVTGDPDEIVTESSWGMGAAIVDGRVTPDRTVLERRGLGMKESQVSRKRFRVSTRLKGLHEGRVEEVPFTEQHSRSLSPEQAIAIAQLALEAEAHFGAPQDVEWAIEDGKIHLLQSRPVTVVGKREFCRNEGKGKYVAFKPMLENFTDPLTPLTANLWLQGPVAGIMALIGGRPYVDLTKVRLLTPFELTDEQLGQLIYLNPEGVPSKLKLRAARVPGVLLAGIIVTLVYANAWARTAQLPADFMDSYRKVAKAVDEDESYGVRDTLRELFLGTSVVRTLLAPIGRQVLLVNTTTLRYLLWFWFLKRLIRRYLPGAPADTLSLLSSGSEGVLSAEAGRRIWHLAAEARENETVRGLLTRHPPEEVVSVLQKTPEASGFLERLDEFLKAFGHRAVREFEYGSRRWEEDPAQVLGMIRNYLSVEADPSEHERKIAERREDLDRAIRTELESLPLERLTHWRVGLIRWVARRVKYFARMRENSRFYWVMGANIVRKKILRLEDRLIHEGRLKCQDDIFYLDWAEIERLSRGELGWHDVEQQIADRRRDLIRLSKLTPPRMIGIEQSEKPSREERVRDSHELRGQSASPGLVEGVARVIHDPAQDAELEPGEILVAPYTDPAWTPLFLTAGGAVVEVGSFLSHAGTVAREYGLPCVVDVPDCTDRIETGDRIEVNGDEGTVQILTGKEKL